jgi:hypothetical protein
MTPARAKDDSRGERAGRGRHTATSVARKAYRIYADRLTATAILTDPAR